MKKFLFYLQAFLCTEIVLIFANIVMRTFIEEEFDSEEIMYFAPKVFVTTLFTFLIFVILTESKYLKVKNSGDLTDTLVTAVCIVLPLLTGVFYFKNLFGINAAVTKVELSWAMFAMSFIFGLYHVRYSLIINIAAAIFPVIILGDNLRWLYIYSNLMIATGIALGIKFFFFTKWHKWPEQLKKGPQPEQATS